MNDFAEQIEALRKRTDARHARTLAKLDAQRAERKADMDAFREDMMRAITEAFDRQELRLESRAEGLEAILREDVNAQSQLSLLCGIVTNALLEHQIQSLEIRVSSLEQGRHPAA